MFSIAVGLKTVPRSVLEDGGMPSDERCTGRLEPQPGSRQEVVESTVVDISVDSEHCFESASIIDICSAINSTGYCNHFSSIIECHSFRTFRFHQFSLL